MATWDKLLWQTDKYGDDKATNTASTTPKTSCLPPVQLLCHFPHMRTRSRDFCDFSDFKIFQTCPHKQKHLAAAVDILLKYTSQADSQLILQIHKSTHPSKSQWKPYSLDTYKIYISWNLLSRQLVKTDRFSGLCKKIPGREEVRVGTFCSPICLDTPPHPTLPYPMFGHLTPPRQWLLK